MPVAGGPVAPSARMQSPRAVAAVVLHNGVNQGDAIVPSCGLAASGAECQGGQRPCLLGSQPVRVMVSPATHGESMSDADSDEPIPSAVVTALNRASSLNGLKRQSTAPCSSMRARRISSLRAVT